MMGRRLLLLVVLSLHSIVQAQEVHPDVVVVLNVTGGVTPGGDSWADSYSVDNQCFCMSTFDHNIGNYFVETPLGWKTTREICEILGEGPGSANRPLYNDIQCGNGPPNDAGDEHVCPGRVDVGQAGCGHIGPRWNFDNVSNVKPPTNTVPSDAHSDIRAVLNVTGGISPNMTMASSYSIDGNCYCASSDLINNNVDSFYVETPMGWKTVKDVCILLGPGRELEEDEVPVFFNDVQCGNGPPDDAGDEHACPGRVDMKEEGCGHIGPRWSFPPVMMPTSAPSKATEGQPTLVPTSSAANSFGLFALQPLTLVSVLLTVFAYVCI